MPWSSRTASSRSSGPDRRRRTGVRAGGYWAWGVRRRLAGGLVLLALLVSLGGGASPPGPVPAGPRRPTSVCSPRAHRRTCSCSRPTRRRSRRSRVGRRWKPCPASASSVCSPPGSRVTTIRRATSRSAIRYPTHRSPRRSRAWSGDGSPTPAPLARRSSPSSTLGGSGSAWATTSPTDPSSWTTRPVRPSAVASTRWPRSRWSASSASSSRSGAATSRRSPRPT